MMDNENAIQKKVGELKSMGVNVKDGKEKEKPETPAGDADEGSKYETTPVIERAREERERMEAATKAQKEQNDRTELIMAKQALGGEAEAGQSSEPKEETDKEYRQRIDKELAEGKHND